MVLFKILIFFIRPILGSSFVVNATLRRYNIDVSGCIFDHRQLSIETYHPYNRRWQKTNMLCVYVTKSKKLTWCKVIFVYWMFTLTSKFHSICHASDSICSKIRRSRKEWRTINNIDFFLKYDRLSSTYVTILTDSAEVRRSVEIKTKKGSNEVIIRKSPVSIEPGSIRVDGGGKAEIFGVNFRQKKKPHSKMSVPQSIQPTSIYYFFCFLFFLSLIFELFKVCESEKRSIESWTNSTAKRERQTEKEKEIFAAIARTHSVNHGWTINWIYNTWRFNWQRQRESEISIILFEKVDQILLFGLPFQKMLLRAPLPRLAKYFTLY